jgi:cell division protein FtsW
MIARGKLDWPLFVTVVALACFGLVMVYSASSVLAEVRLNRASSYFLIRQLAAAVLGFVLLMALSQGDYRRLKSPAWAFTGIGLSIISLIAVYRIDTRRHRWLELGFGSLQPSEFAKPALVVFLAWFVTRRATAINSRYTLLPASLAVVAISIAVGIADVGTALVLAATAAAVFYVAAVEKKYLAVALAAGVVLLAIALFSRPYRVLRLINKVDPGYTYLGKVDPEKKLRNWAERGAKVKDTNYQGFQSRIAVATGGLIGAGLMESKQKLLFLPEVHTDFIYGLISEELGMFGSVAVLFAYVFILFRGYRLYWSAVDDFGRYLAVGITTCLVFQALMNMSVALDMGPTKGIPLPLISYGGSSLLSSMILFGLLLSVSERAAAAEEAVD